MAGITSSRNRFGQYVRSRSTPVNPGTVQQGAVRARLATNASNWRGLSDAQRAGWEDLALNITRTDALGQGYTLNGFGAYVSVNNNLLAAGESALSDAPALDVPDPLTSLSVTATPSALSLAYTPTPLGTGVKAFIYAGPQRSSGRLFEGDLRLLTVTSAAAASPANILSAYTAKFGAPVAGNRIHFAVALHKGGFRSGVLKATAVVASS